MLGGAEVVLPNVVDGGDGNDPGDGNDLGPDLQHVGDHCPEIKPGYFLCHN